MLYLGFLFTIRPRRLYEAMCEGARFVGGLDADGCWRLRYIPFWYLSYLWLRFQRDQLERIAPNWEPPFPSLLRRWQRRLSLVVDECRKSTCDAVRKNKITLVTGSLGPGGAERQLVYTAASLVEDGWNVDAVCISSDAEFAFYHRRLEKHVDVMLGSEAPSALLRSDDPDLARFLEMMRSSGYGQLRALLPHSILQNVLSLAVILLIKRTAVVHLWQDHTNLIGGLAALIVGVPRIVLAGRSAAPHNFAYHRRYMRRMYKLLLQYKHVKLINNSEAGRRSYAEWLDVPADQLSVVHNGIDKQAFRPGADARVHMRNRWLLHYGDLVVGGIFRLSPEKDPFLWLDTARSVLRKLPDTHFVLIGDGAMRMQIEERVVHLGLGHRVHLVGLEESVADALAAFDALVLTSVNEGLPNVLIEAQLVGCPVVATDVGGCAEVVAQGETGWLVGERSPEALAERICQVLSDNDWRKRARQEGPNHVERCFGLDRMLSSTLKVYGLDGRT